MEWLDVHNGSAALLPTINPHGAGFAQLNGDDPGRRNRHQKGAFFVPKTSF